MIKAVSIDDSGRILVKVGGDYDFIYRDASSVRWDRKLRCLYVLPEARLGAVESFKQILGAVAREYGHRLKTNPLTKWTNVPQDLRREIKKAGRNFHNST